MKNHYAVATLGFFSRGIDRVEGKPELGETVDVYDNKGEWLARGCLLSTVSNSRSRMDIQQK